MLKKRIIFTLLYDNGHFFMSRNFRLQKMGDLNWLNKNYNFSKVAFSIDELIVLNVSREEKGKEEFCHELRELVEECFIPISVGGGINSYSYAESLMQAGADKLVVNTALFETPDFVKGLAEKYGSQCVVASIDVMEKAQRFMVLIRNASEVIPHELKDWLMMVNDIGVGEIYLNSINKDGTGMGYQLELLEQISDSFELPIILSGGAGNYEHFIKGLEHPKVDAVATANLINFIGNGLPNSREILLEKGYSLPRWDLEKIQHLKGFFNSNVCMG